MGTGLIAALNGKSEERRVSAHEKAIKPKGILIEALNDIDIAEFPSALAKTGKKEFVKPMRSLISAVRNGDERAARTQMQAVLDIFASYMPSGREARHSRSDTAIPMFIDAQLREVVRVVGLEGTILFPVNGGAA